MGFKVGITGGIGSGKSLVCKVFGTLGVPIYNADAAAKSIMVEDAAVVAALKSSFGEMVYLPDGALNRKHLSEIVFNDKQQLDKLNAIVHPAVIQAAEDWANRQTTAYSLKEAALLFESGSYVSLDYTILVVAPEEVRIQRVVARDGSAVDEVKARIDKQWDDDRKAELADFILINDGIQPLIPQILDIHHKLLQR